MTPSKRVFGHNSLGFPQSMKAQDLLKGSDPRMNKFLLEHSIQHRKKRKIRSLAKQAEKLGHEQNSFDSHEPMELG